jgi:hypothetical protein
MNDVSKHEANKELHQMPKDSPPDGTTMKAVQATAGVVGAAAAGYVAGHMVGRRSVRPGRGGGVGETSAY